MSAPSAAQRARLREIVASIVAHKDAVMWVDPAWVTEWLDAVDAAEFARDALERRLAATEKILGMWSRMPVDVIHRWVDTALAKEAGDGE